MTIVDQSLKHCNELLNWILLRVCNLESYFLKYKSSEDWNEALFACYTTKVELI